MVLLLVAGFTFAQVKNVKDAKSIANGTNPDFDKAEQLINAALTDSETKDDPNTWDVAGYIQKRIGDTQMEKAYLRQPYDTMKVYDSALEMCKLYLKCDELAQVPDEKGKIKNKYRKPNGDSMLGARGNLINGGITYFNNDDNKKAMEFFGMYIDIAKSPMLENQHLLQTDTVLPQIAYYAALAGMKLEDYKSVKEYASYGKTDKEVGKYAMEFYCTALKNLGEDDAFLAALKEGLQMYPEHDYFFANMIDYYTNNEKFDEAQSFADEMLAKDPSNTFYLYVKGFLYYNMKDYDSAIAAFEKLIDVDPDYAQAYSYLGVIYCIQAQDFSEQATADVNDPKYEEDQATLRAFYEKARPVYEKARQLKPDETDLWLNGLYRVYYNLNMGPEFEEIEKLMQ